MATLTDRNGMNGCAATSPPPRTLVLGIGNVLWADEGFGVRAVERLHEAWELPAGVTLMDGGTQGLYLLHHVEACEALIVFDAVDYGLAPGEMKLVEDDEVPAFLGVKKMSLHQTGFQEVIATARLKGWEPRRMLLIGVQPEELEDYGGGLRPIVAARLDEAVTCAIDELRRLGHVPRRRRGSRPPEPLSAPAISRESYEAGRPSAEEACRVGDARSLTLLPGEKG